MMRKLVGDVLHYFMYYGGYFPGKYRLPKMLPTSVTRVLNVAISNLTPACQLLVVFFTDPFVHMIQYASSQHVLLNAFSKYCMIVGTLGVSYIVETLVICYLDLFISFFVIFLCILSV